MITIALRTGQANQRKSDRKYFHEESSCKKNIHRYVKCGICERKVELRSMRVLNINRQLSKEDKEFTQCLR